MDLNVICNKNTDSYEYVYSITSGSITGAIEILTLWPFEYIRSLEGISMNLTPRT